ncbi:MAG TPA: ribosome maturation factor RimP [Haliangiales bacterium]|nr:ribosome maturation factor RimP [Haliangiales bacterium]
MNPRETAETLTAIIEPPVEGAGYELVDLAYVREPHGWVVRVFIDGPHGVAHADCERVSRELSAVLDVHDVIPHAYTLEVSSPGLDRPLRTAAHFARFVGQKARVKLHHGVGGRRNFSGTIRAVSPSGTDVTLDVDGAAFVLPLADLERANLEYRFPKSGR